MYYDLGSDPAEHNNLFPAKLDGGWMFELFLAHIGQLENPSPDVAEAVAAAKAAGSNEHIPVADLGDGIVTATVRTPEGSILRLIYNPNFSLD